MSAATSTIVLRSVLGSALFFAETAAALAATDADFKAAYAAAAAAENDAGQLRDQWTTTEAALTAAKKAAGAGDFDAAVAQAKEAEALAKASVFQATSEQDRWQAIEIR